MAYPVLITQESSRKEVADGRVMLRATNGALKTRRLFTSDKASFDLSHFVDTTDKDALLSYYSSNKDADFDYVWPADKSSYVVRFASAPQVDSVGSEWWTVKVRLEEV